MVGSGVYVDDVDRIVRTFNWTALGGVIAICAILAVVVYRLVRRMIRPLDDLVHDLQNSDLSRQIQIESEDEIGEAAQAFNQYNAGLREKIEELAGYAHRVASGSNELSASAEEMSHAVEEIARVSEDLKAAGEQVARAMGGLAQSAAQAAQETDASGRESRDAVAETDQSARTG